MIINHLFSGYSDTVKRNKKSSTSSPSSLYGLDIIAYSIC